MKDRMKQLLLLLLLM